MARGTRLGKDVLDLVAAAAAPAFAMDRKDRIVFWNAGAASITGWSGEEVLGRFCFDVLSGRDLFGNLYCTAECPLVASAAHGEDIAPFLIDMTRKDGRRERIRVQTVPLPGPGAAFQALLHLVASESGDESADVVDQLRQLARADREPAPDPALSVCPLTKREKEILRLIANGYAALNIAAKLSLSHATVRNHIQNILRKIDVHSQVEAISVSFRRGWLTAES